MAAACHDVIVSRRVNDHCSLFFQSCQIKISYHPHTLEKERDMQEELTPQEQGSPQEQLTLQEQLHPQLNPITIFLTRLH